MSGFPSSWIIEVCRTCGRLAQWPFCEHRDQPRPEEERWCAPIRVRGSLSQQTRLAQPAVPADGAGETRGGR